MAHQSLGCVVPDGTVPTDGTLPRTASRQDIEWPVGDGGTIDVACTGEDGEIYDLDGCALTLVCREHTADEAYIFAYDAVVDVPGQGESPAGTATFTLDAADTANLVAGKVYWYDVRLVADDDTVYHVIPPSKLTPTFTIARADEPPAPEPPP
jgi:hypothetical protein